MLREYVEWIGLDLAFQEIDAELDGLPGEYAPPRGALFVAVEGDRYLGMIALRPLDGTIAEMKRLYVRPAFQKSGLGRALCERLIGAAREAGYRSMLLDTLPTMQSAIRLYESAGFVRRSSYYETPVAETIFMERAL